MTNERSPIPLWWPIAGFALCVLSLLACLWDPQAALRAWLGSAFFWSGIPIGALLLLMTMRLIPGGWANELLVFAETATLLMPLAALMFIPVLLGIGSIYDWADQPPRNAFQSIYLIPWFFAARTLIWFALLGAFTFLLSQRRGNFTILSCIGLLIFVPMSTMIAVDWIMSLDPAFSSSGFGLYILSSQVGTSLVWISGTALLLKPHLRRISLLSGLLLLLLLLWTYFAFMQYIITWSGNLPQGVLWYKRQSSEGWSHVEWAISGLHLLPAFILMLPVRSSKTWLFAMCVAVLAGKILEASWLTLTGVTSPLSLGLFVLSLSGTGLIVATAFMETFRYRVSARSPSSVEVGEAS
ncbi:hypothetical protein [Microvirga puerhi]|uniref:Quinol:cytochrome c oxidoreductase quinone-binding subunit 2 n=1 Tax=Microvirga puerhi TaxID=2876078 RepID=A0ABS7VL22_9HYPH|nr:hypothetical protein [Microvirga puerhi]MBZ6075702.1 hypothetical protein [Microvirga puerhi]